MRSPFLPVPPDRRARRTAQLLAGLVLYGATAAMMVLAGLGLDPWDVLHQGLAPRIGLSFGLTVNLVGLIVLLLWALLRQRPGVGTVLNILVIGTVTDLALAVIPPPQGYPLRFALLGFGILLNGVASGAYIGAGLGPGPRDGLMTGLCRRTALPVKYVRTAIELTALGVGWMLGGTVGFGTLLYAVCIGWVIHHALPAFAFDKAARQPAPSKDAGATASPTTWPRLSGPRRNRS
jgi:uncharacterized membrane protein YczE